MSVYKTCCEHCNDVGQSKTASIEAMLSVDESSCHRIGNIVNESSYVVAESSQSFTESSCLDTLRYDTIEEINVDSKAEYTA